MKKGILLSVVALALVFGGNGCKKAEEKVEQNPADTAKTKIKQDAIDTGKIKAKHAQPAGYTTTIMAPNVATNSIDVVIAGVGGVYNQVYFQFNNIVGCPNAYMTILNPDGSILKALKPGGNYTYAPNADINLQVYTTYTGQYPNAGYVFFDNVFNNAADMLQSYSGLYLKNNLYTALVTIVDEGHP
jgi:hypothetical protein